MKKINELFGKKVIIRADRAGVFYGILTDVEPCGNQLNVELTNCRRLWYWSGAASLSQMANEGVKNHDECKFTVTVYSIIIGGVIEILPTTELAQTSIEGVKIWRC